MEELTEQNLKRIKQAAEDARTIAEELLPDEQTAAELILEAFAEAESKTANFNKWSPLQKQTFAVHYAFMKGAYSALVLMQE